MALQSDLEDAMRQLFRELNGLNGFLFQIIAQMLAGNVSVMVINQTLTQLVDARNDIVDLKGRAGALQFARNIYGNPTLDIVAQLNTVQTAIQNAGVTARAGLSSISDGNGWVGAFKLSAAPDDPIQILWREFTPAQTATLRTDLTAVRSAIAAFRTSSTGG